MYRDNLAVGSVALTVYLYGTNVLFIIVIVLSGEATTLYSEFVWSIEAVLETLIYYHICVCMCVWNIIF